MKKFRCSGCGSTIVIGYLFDSLKLAICSRCREASLSFIKDAGIFMDMSHPVIAELCECANSLDEDELKFFDWLNPDKPGKVLKATPAGDESKEKNKQSS